MTEEPRPYRRTSEGRQGRRGWLFWVLVVGVPLAVVAYAGILGGIGYLFVVTTKSLPVGQSEWDAVVDASDVAQWMPDHEVSTQGESLELLRYLDRSYELSYEYASEDGALYVSSSLSIERKITDAVAAYLSLWPATVAGIMLAGHDEVTLEPMGSFFEWGDQSKTGLLKTGGEPYGHLFVARKGKRVVFLLLNGLYFDDAELWSEFITPTLDNVAAYEPAD